MNKKINTETPAETKSRRVPLLMRPSLYETISAAAWQEHMTTNGYITKVLEDHARKLERKQKEKNEK